MPDIRKSGILDDFNRPYEYPILPPWYLVANTGFFLSAQANGTAWQAAPQFSVITMTYWGVQSYSGDIEAWATCTGLPDNREHFRIGFFKDVTIVNGWSGYLVLVGKDVAGGDYWDLRRYDAGSPTSIASSPATSVSSGQHVLIRRNGTSVEVWRSTGDLETWSLITSAIDTSYSTDFYLILGAGSDDTNEGWDNFGGGIKKPFGPQIYRRINE